MSKKIEIILVTPNVTNHDKYKFYGHGDMVVMRCITGDIGILPGRVACSAILSDGVLRIMDGDEKLKIAIMGGVFQFKNDVLTIVTKNALLPGEIDISATKIQISEYENRLIHENNVTEKDKIRKILRRQKVLLDVATA